MAKHGNIKNFETFLKEGFQHRTKLTEAISGKNMSAVGKIISKYLTKKLGEPFSFDCQVEVFNNPRVGSNAKGLSFIYDKGLKKVRFNWKASQKIDSASLHSVDVWLSPKICYSMEFDTSVSLAQILPQTAEFIKNPVEGEIVIIPEDLNESVDFLTEARKGDYSLNELWKMTIDILIPGDKPNINKIQNIDPRLYLIYKAIKKTFPEFWAGLKYVGNAQGGKEAKFIIQQHQGEILKAAGIIKGNITKVSTTSETIVTPVTPEIEEYAKKADAAGGIAKLSYEETLEDLKMLVNELILGVSNGLFITGRGGVGKSYNIEQLLLAKGLGNGTEPVNNKAVWLNTSVSATSLYRKLAQNPDAIFLVDDADDIFKDETGRNLLKAATDTKKVRTLNWAKRGDGVLPLNKINLLIKQKREALERALEGENLDKIAKLESELESLELIVPDKFEFRGRIIFISNLNIPKLDLDGSLRTRGSIINVYPSDEEVFEFMKKLSVLVDTSAVESEGGSPVPQELRYEVIDTLRDYFESGIITKPLNMRMMEFAIKKCSSHLHMGDTVWKRSLRYI